MRMAPVLLFLFLVLAVQSFGQNKQCANCGKPIERTAVSAEGKFYHPEHFTCAYCKKMLEGGYVKDGERLLHQECYAVEKNLICAVCNNVLTGEYVTYDGKLFHNACYTERIQKKCVICRQGITASYLENQYGDIYHARHKDEYEECFSCNRLMAPGISGLSRSYSDGRKICTICVQEYMPMDAEFTSILQKVTQCLKDLGLAVSLNNISINGVNRIELKRKMGSEYTESSRGFCNSQKSTQTQNGKVVSEKNTHTIYVLNGLPLTQTEGIVAHELMHAWIFEQSKKKLSLRQNEGTCNFVSWTYLKSLPDGRGLQAARRIEKDPDPVYGDGFREIKQGFSSLTQLVQTLTK